jgi:hypothetical protein
MRTHVADVGLAMRVAEALVKESVEARSLEGYKLRLSECAEQEDRTMAMACEMALIELS